MIQKPRIFWQYYPKSKRGFWRIAATPSKWWKDRYNSPIWRTAHKVVGKMNAEIADQIEYAHQYAKQLELRKTT